MDNIKTHIFLFFIPLIIGNILHMVVVKKNWFSFLGVPISTPTFGKNKTYRGFVILPILCGLVAYFDSIFFGPFSQSNGYDLFVGFGLGLVYALSELPNSYVKRRIGIQTGETSKKHKLLQTILDKTDSLIGVLIFYYLVIPVSLQSVLIIFFVAFSIHLFLSWLLVLIKVKKSF